MVLLVVFASALPLVSFITPPTNLLTTFRWPACRAATSLGIALITRRHISLKSGSIPVRDEDAVIEIRFMSTASCLTDADEGGLLSMCRNTSLADGPVSSFDATISIIPPSW